MSNDKFFSHETIRTFADVLRNQAMRHDPHVDWKLLQLAVERYREINSPKDIVGILEDLKFFHRYETAFVTFRFNTLKLMLHSDMDLSFLNKMTLEGRSVSRSRHVGVRFVSDSTYSLRKLASGFPSLTSLNLS